MADVKIAVAGDDKRDGLDGRDRLVGYLGLFLLGRVERRYRNKPSIIFIVFIVVIVPDPFYLLVAIKTGI